MTIYNWDITDVTLDELKCFMVGFIIFVMIEHKSNVLLICTKEDNRNVLSNMLYIIGNTMTKRTIRYQRLNWNLYKMDIINYKNPPSIAKQNKTLVGLL